MINFIKGDILKKDAEAIVNTVNCVGVMGRGIALQFRKAFPNNFKAYEAACKRDEVKPGQMLIHDTGSFCNPRYIVNFPTKRHWKGSSKIEDIRSGLVALVDDVKKYNIKSIAIPPLGCGLGGLNWADVRIEILKAFQDVSDIEVYVFEPAGAPEAGSMVKDSQIPKMTVGRASLIALMRRYLSAVMDPTVTLLELQKLMYFMQETGEPLQLKYSKAQYGPYANNLGQVLNRIEGHFVSGYLDGGDSPTKPLELKTDAIEHAESFLENHHETLSRFGRVTNLIQGFETPYGMELLATVHWVVTKDGASSLEEVIKGTHAWNERKKMFTEKHIEIAFQTLKNNSWLQ